MQAEMAGPAMQALAFPTMAVPSAAVCHLQQSVHFLFYSHQWLAYLQQSKGRPDCRSASLTLLCCCFQCSIQKSLFACSKMLAGLWLQAERAATAVPVPGLQAEASNLQPTGDAESQLWPPSCPLITAHRRPMADGIHTQHSAVH